MLTNLIHKPLIILAVTLSTNIEPAKVEPIARVPYQLSTNVGHVAQVIVPHDAPLTNKVMMELFHRPVTNVFTNYSFGYLDGTNAVWLGNILTGPGR